MRVDLGARGGDGLQYLNTMQERGRAYHDPPKQGGMKARDPALPLVRREFCSYVAQGLREGLRRLDGGQVGAQRAILTEWSAGPLDEHVDGVFVSGERFESVARLNGTPVGRNATGSECVGGYGGHVELINGLLPGT
ncbi:hypothetical protein GGTG_12525 [Gaeumannomyces tritici R3-111a-1]|uniref:Uncharacterized protein n=1 Tax=Gaeumannomyces tritici (strain R3-111a-1) TaxID=644352 RepID=J3PGA1_GAET3|nr:hypothetical protein GGTG_12525 [Gaeumannomyces tritici R3-111a-1]EJT69641.1 hypothetical protein GGTG_12525 [Gaeumannomyces tritici R3-111a-1]